jgi:hypothetical protein
MESKQASEKPKCTCQASLQPPPVQKKEEQPSKQTPSGLDKTQFSKKNDSYSNIAALRMPFIYETNPDLKNTVRDFIVEFVEDIVGEERAPEVIDILVQLPITKLKYVLSDYEHLTEGVLEAFGNTKNRK